jgi:hypothetical protein
MLSDILATSANGESTMNHTRARLGSLRMRRLGCLAALSLFTAGMTVLTGHGQEPPAAATNDQNAAAAAEFAAQEAPRYKIHRQDARQGFALEEKPLLRWSNPVRAEVYGTVVLWTEKKCPAALGSIYRYFDRNQINVELVSLLDAPLVAERSGVVRWRSGAGVKYLPLPEAPQAAESAERRKLQMRKLAQQFTAQLAERDNDGKFSELRLMSRPIYQYTASDNSGREGALFAFVTTNDPEALLIVESASDGRERSWRYAAARLNFCRLQLKLGEKVVWDVPQLAPPWEKLRGPDGDYLILQWDTLADAEKDGSPTSSPARD